MYFTWEILIFSRVQCLKIRQKSSKNSKLEVKIGFWRPKITHDVDFDGQDDDFGGQGGGFGGQEGDFEAKNGQTYLGHRFLREVGGMAEACSEARIERV